jgi:hypothetical protein
VLYEPAQFEQLTDELWDPAQLADTNGRIRLQWCTGAPGVLAGACEYLDEELLLAGAELILASRRPRRREGPWDLSRHLGQRVRAPQGFRAHGRRPLA